MDGRRWERELMVEPPATWLGLVAALAAAAVGSLLVLALEPVAPVVSLGVVYLPPILLVSIIWGLRLALVAAVACAVAFNFFFFAPLHQFTIADEQNWVALVTFAIAAAISSTVAGLARARTVEAERRREEADGALAQAAALARERDLIQAEVVEAEALRRSDELKTALLRSISHDLRTPLTSMIACGAALGSETLTTSERAELSEGIVAEGERLSRLVENLLDMSRLEAGSAEPHREQIDLAEVIEGARATIAQPESVRVAIDPDLPTIDADAPQLERAFANLLDNAVRHGGGAPVSVTSTLRDGEIAIRVIDRGPGIPERERGRIFEPFQRGSGAGGPAGFGLGLAIARGFVTANGGAIAVETPPAEGTSFVVSLPVASEGSR